MTQTIEPSPSAELTDLEAAVEAAARQPHDGTLWNAAEELVAQTQAPEALADLYAEMLGRDLGGPALRELSARALRFIEEWFSDETPRALAVLQRVFARDPADRALLERLALGLGSAGEWAQLMDVYDQALSATDSLEEKAKLLAEAARVAKDVAEDVDRAVGYMQRLLPLRPHDAQLRQSLERLLEREERFSQLIDLWRSGLEGLDRDAAAELSVRIADCWVQKLHNPPAAVDMLVEAAAEHADHPALCEALERMCALEDASRSARAMALQCVADLYRKAERPADLARALRVGVSFEEPAAREALLRELVGVLRALGEHAEVLARLGELLGLQPDEDALLDEVAEAAAVVDDAAMHARILRNAAQQASHTARRDALLLRAARVAAAGGLVDGAAETFGELLDGADDVALRREAGASLIALLREQSGHVELRLHALSAYAALVDGEDEWPAVMGELSNLRAARGEHEQALSAWQARLSRDAEDREALDGSIDVLRSAQRLAPLVEALRRRIALSGDDAARRARDLADMASIQVGPLGDVRAALATWRELAGEDVEVLAETGGAETARGRARDAFEDAASLQVAVGDALRDVWGDLAAAAEHYARALRMKPDLDLAQQGLRAVLDDPALRPLAAEELGRAFGQLGDIQGQLEVLQARVLSQDDPRKRRALWTEAASLCEVEQSDMASAFAHQCEAFLCVPADPACDDELARLAQATGEHSRYAGVLAEGRRVLGEGPRSTLLLEREAQLRVYELEQHQTGLSLYLDLHGQDPGREAWAHETVRLALALGEVDTAAAAWLAHARATGAVSSVLAECFAGEQGHASVEACTALARVLPEAGLSAEVTRELAVRLGHWCEAAGAGPDLVEQAWTIAHEAGAAERNVLAHLVEARRRQPDALLFETLLQWSRLLDEPTAALQEATRVALQSLGDDALARRSLEPLTRHATSAQARQRDPEGAREAAVWAVTRMAEIQERAGAHAELLATLQLGAFIEPPGDDTLKLGLRAAQLAQQTLGDRDAALTAYARLFEQRPDHPDTVRALVRLLEELEQDQRALVTLERALGAAGGSEWRGELRLWLVRVAGRIEARDPRVTALRDNLRDQPGEPNTLDALEAVLRARGALPEWYDTLMQQAAAVRAEGHAERATELYQSAALLAREELGDAKRALSAFKEVAELSPGARVFHAMATLHEQRQEPERAQPWLERLLAERPDDESVRLRLAEALEGARHPAQAEACLREGVRVEPGSLPLRHALAALLERLGNERAVADLHADTVHHSEDPTVILESARRAARAYERLGMPELGVTMLERAVSVAGDDRALRCAFADALIAAGTLDRARELLRTMVEAYGRRRSPERAEIHLRLARVARAAGQTDEALSELDAAAGMSRGDINTLRTLAQLAEAAGEWDRAEKALRSLLMTTRRSDGGQPAVSASELQYGLHRIAKARGQEERAAELLQSALETAAQSEEDAALFKRSLLESGEPELLLQVLEMRLSTVKDAATEARVLADLAEVLEGPLGRAEEALDAQVKALMAAPAEEALHAGARKLARKLGATSRYVECLGQLLERARRREDAHEAGVVAMQLGDLHEHETGELALAREAYARVEPQTSQYVDAQLGVARVAGKQGRRDEERQVLETLLKSAEVGDEAQMRVRYRLLELAVQDADARDGALDSVQDLLERYPSSFAAAVAVLEVACDSDPEDGRAPSLLEEVCRKSGDPELLLRFFERHARQADASLELLREGAELAHEQEQLDRARALYEQATRLAEAGAGLVDAIWAPVALGSIAREQGDMDSSLEWLARAAGAAEGEEGFALGIELAQVASGQGRRELAIETYQRLRQREPGDRRVYRPLFSLYREAGDLQAAHALTRQTTEAVLDTDERNELRADFAQMAIRAGEVAMAEQVLRDGLEDDPEDERCAMLLADQLERQGRDADLADLLGRKLEVAHARRSPSIVPLSLRMGGLLQDTRPEDAVHVYRTALSIVPADPGLLRASVSLMDPQEQAVERAPLVERLLAADPPEDAAQLALWLLDHAASHGSEADVERAMALGFQVAPDDEGLRERLEQWYRKRQEWPKLAEMLVTQASRARDDARAVVLLSEAAEVYLDKLGDHESAAELLRSARERDPNNQQLMRLSILSSARAGHAEQALTDVDAALAQAADAQARAGLHSLRAEVLADAGDALAAVEDLEKAYALGGAGLVERLLAGLSRARAAAEARGDAERERALLLRVLEIADANEDVEAPLEALASWVERHPEDVAAAEELLQRQAQAERPADVLVTAERVLQVAELESAHVAAGQLVDAAQTLTQPAAAVRGLELALGRFPGDAVLRDLLAGIYEAIGADEQLAQLLLANLPPEDRAEDRFEVLRRAGHLLLGAGRGHEALSVLENALALKPDDQDIRLLVIDAHLKAGNYPQAQSLIEQAMEGIRARRSPELAVLRQRMSVLCDLAGDQRARYEWLAIALEADMNNGAIASETATLAQELGEVDVALKALRAVTMIKTECPMSRAEAFLRQAQIVAHKGEKRRAALWAKKAKAEDPEFPGVDELLASLSG